MPDLKIGYARVSTAAQDLSAQRDALAALGVDAKRIYVDHGLTGTNRELPGLREALAACAIRATPSSSPSSTGSPAPSPTAATSSTTSPPEASGSTSAGPCTIRLTRSAGCSSRPILRRVHRDPGTWSAWEVRFNSCLPRAHATAAGPARGQVTASSAGLWSCRDGRSDCLSGHEVDAEREARRRLRPLVSTWHLESAATSARRGCPSRAPASTWPCRR